MVAGQPIGQEVGVLQPCQKIRNLCWRISQKPQTALARSGLGELSAATGSQVDGAEPVVRGGRKRASCRLDGLAEGSLQPVAEQGASVLRCFAKLLRESGQ